MPIFMMPKLGHLMEQGTITAWLKKEGEPVEKGEVILQVETDKSVLDVESGFSGTLVKIFAEEGEAIPVNEPIAEIK